MITVEDVHKKYIINGTPRWVLRDVNLTFPRDRSVAIIGGNGAGKSTLIRLLAGTDTPDRGRVRRHCRVSWPIGQARAMQRTMTGRQNARFICRLYGFADEIDERVAFVQRYSELGDTFDKPVQSYSAGQRARLTFAMTFAFDFDMYLIDEAMGAGDAQFRGKAKRAFMERAERSTVVLVSHNPRLVRELCRAGVWIHDGRAEWFDDVNDALEAFGGAGEASDDASEDDE